MKKIYTPIFKILIFGVLILTITETKAQTTSTQSEFWKKVQFGGGLSLNFGSGFTNVGVSPSMLYNVNEYFSVGTGLQISYVSAKNNYSSLIYGVNVLTLFNPIENIQLSVDLEQLKVNTAFDNSAFGKQSFWNTGLWLGAGYRTNNITIGGRYNVLFNKDKSVFSDAFLPFVRVYF